MATHSYLSPVQIAELSSQLNSTNHSLSSDQAQLIDRTLRGVIDLYPTKVKYELASELVDHHEASVRIFASLLLTSVASSAQAANLREPYMNYISHAARSHRSRLELRKLCDAVAALYCSVGNWPDCFQDYLIRCKPALDQSQDVSPSGNEIIQPHILEAALILADALTDQTKRLHERDAQNDAANQIFLKTASDLFRFLSGVLTLGGSGDLIESPLAVLKNLLEHPALVQAHDAKLAADVQTIFNQALKLMENDPSRIRDIAGLTEVVLTNYSVPTDVWHALVRHAADSTNGAVSLIAQGHSGVRHMADTAAARDLLLSIAYHALEKEELLSAVTESYWSRILEALNPELYSESEDDERQRITQLLEFWNEFIDSAIMAGAEGTLTTGDIQGIQRMIEAVVYQVIPALATSAYEGDDGEESSYPREEASHLLQTVYSFFQQNFVHGESSNAPGTSGMNRLLSLLVDDYNVRTRHLTDSMRLATFIAIADYASKRDADDAAVAIILGLPVFSRGDTISSLNLSECVLSAAFIGSYSTYFYRHPELLDGALQHLFALLQGLPSCVKRCAVESLSKLCRKCCIQLIPYAPTLLDHYAAVSTLLWSIKGTKELLFGACAAVCFAEDQQTGSRTEIMVITRILQSEIESVISSSASSAEGDLSDRAAHVDNGLAILKSIRQLGLATSQGFDSAVPIDLDGDGDGEKLHEKFLQMTDAALSQHLTYCISQTLTIPGIADSEEALHLLCEIFCFKTQHGVSAIFNFPLSLHLEVLRVCVGKQLAADYALATFATILAASRSRRNAETDQTIEGALTFVMQHIHQQAVGTGDPDILTSALEFLTTYVRGFADIVGNLMSDFAALLLMLNDLITVPESLPKSAVCGLWLTILDDQHGMISQLSEQHLQTLIWNLCTQITGGASQRDLDVLSSLIGKLVVKGTNVRNTFEGAFKMMEIQNLNVSGWQRFVGQIFMLRGKKAETRNVVTRFWEQCKQGGSGLQVESDDSDGELIMLN